MKMNNYPPFLTRAQISQNLELIQRKFAGKYLALEGLDGSGKSSLQKWLADLFNDSFTPVGEQEQIIRCIREPGSTEVAEKIREILLHSNYKLDAYTELMLFMASRSDLLQRVTRHALQRQEIVLSDRCYWSSYAYQAKHNNFKLDFFKELVEQMYRNSHAIDVFVYFDVSYEVGIQRTAATKVLDDIESKGKAYYDLTAAGYQEVLDDFCSNANKLFTYEDKFVVYQHCQTAQYLLVVASDFDYAICQNSLLSGLEYIAQRLA